MSASPISQFELFDILVKVTPGGVFLLLISLILPSSSPLVEAVSGGGIGIILAVIPLVYVVGAIVQGVSGQCFPRQRKFQEEMKKVRRKIQIDTEDLTITHGEAVPRFVWADAVLYFGLNEKYLRPSDSDDKCREYSEPAIYSLLCSPLLQLALALSGSEDKNLDRTRLHYGAEQEVFRLVEQYIRGESIGELERFRSIYLLYRSMVLVSCLLIPSTSTAAIVSFLTGYQSVAGWVALVVVAVAGFALLPVLYKGMVRYDEIRDTEIIHAYYNSRIKDSPITDKYSIRRAK